MTRIYPVLTPMAVDSSRPFPMLLNKSLNLAILLKNEGDLNQKRLFSVCQVPAVLPRFVELPSGKDKAEFILLEDIITKYIHTLYKGNEIVSVSPFRITRNADLTLDEEGAEDLLKEIEKELKKRRLGSEVRLEIEKSMDSEVRDLLKASLHMEDEDIYENEEILDPTFFMKFHGIPGFDELRFEELSPQPPQDLIGEKGIFEAIRDKDIMVHHPYESFDPVVHFVSQAADDPDVLAIKQTLYRVSGDSPIIRALSVRPKTANR